ncbi:hypothetical protein [Methylobacterium sp. V23]|uniref:hypothetical protein n=1 Tax=Methylobacterium sp. V23 TaxID=2044878 RepID=UPI000CDADC6A|nr:hypothetical protein [Methylobacterium sp. V23]POR41959.1 hypothetical protein CRT23_15180 [Methylobacterium sp. V23]
MSTPASVAAVFSAVSDMEEEVRDLVGFAQALCVFGGSSISIPPKAVYVLAEALEATAARLEMQWELAFKLAAEAKQ